MSHIKRYSRFVEEYVMAGPDTDTETGTETETETDKRPSRPGSLPDQEPNVLPNPLAAAKNVIDRFVDIYNQSSKKEQSDIDSYFKK